MSEVHKMILETVYDGMISNIFDSRFICDNVYDVCKSFTSVEKEKYQIRNWISSSIDHLFSYEDWLYHNHNDFYKEISMNNNYELRFQEGRIQWLKWMIENHHVFDNVEVDA